MYIRQITHKAYESLENRSVRALNHSNNNVILQKPNLEDGDCFGSVLDNWLVASRGRLRETTCSTYLSIVESHLRPKFGEIKTPELGSYQVLQYMTDISGESSTFSSATVRGIATVLRGAIAFAEKQGCTASPDDCKCTQKPDRHPITILTDTETASLTAALGNAPEGKDLAILICLKTGLRVGEICSLKWGDILWECGQLCVNRTVSRIKCYDDGKKTTLHFGEPKSSDSRRRIPLTPSLMKLLRAKCRNGDCFILTGCADKIVEPRSLQRHFKVVLKRTGISDLNFHVLRHSFASKWVSRGLDIKSLSIILGHSDVSVTLNTYVHPTMEHIRSMLELLDNDF